MNSVSRLVIGGVVAAAGSAMLAMPVAGAKPNLDPCNPSNVDKVTNQINGYLDRHPDVNQSLIDINNESPGNVSDSYHTYFDNHPDVASELRSLKGPLTNLQCINQSLPSQVVNALSAL